MQSPNRWRDRNVEVFRSRPLAGVRGTHQQASELISQVTRGSTYGGATAAVAEAFQQDALEAK